jgi:RNA polymerase sigma-70 factor (ECF subfamily)
MPAERPFEELMACLRQGDPQASREIFDRYARRLVGLAGAHLPAAVRRKLDPEDIVQSVFRSFFRRQGEGQFEFDSYDQLWSLLTVLAVRKCGHRIREFLTGRRNVCREQPPLAPDDSTSNVWQPADPSPSPAEALLLHETVEELLAGLTERERSVVVMRLQGWTVVEVAEQLRCSERTVLRHLEAVRARLAALAESD